MVKQYVHVKHAVKIPTYADVIPYAVTKTLGKITLQTFLGIFWLLLVVRITCHPSPGGDDPEAGVESALDAAVAEEWAIQNMSCHLNGPL